MYGISAPELRRVSVIGDIDPRTVTRWLAGKPTRYIQGGRVERALLAAGYRHLVERHHRGPRPLELVP